MIARSVLIGVLATPVVAADVPFDPGVLEGCAEAACIGTGAEACREAVEGGLTLGAEVGCFWAESAYWAERSARAEASVAEVFAEAAGELEILQARWDGYTEAFCVFQRAVEFGDGSLGKLVASSCAMRMTGERALFFEGLQER